MFLLPRLISRSARSLAIMLGFASSVRELGRWTGSLGALPSRTPVRRIAPAWPPASILAHSPACHFQ